MKRIITAFFLASFILLIFVSCAKDSTPTSPAPTSTDVPVSTSTSLPAATWTSTSVYTATITITYIPTLIPTATNTNIETMTGTGTPAATSTLTAALTATLTETEMDTQTNTATGTVTDTPTDIETATQTNTVTLTETMTDEGTPTETSTQEDTFTETLTATESMTMTNTPTVTLTGTATSVVTYTVNFDANGGTGSMAGETVNEYTCKRLDTNTFTNTGYDFAGWSPSATGGVAYFDQQEYCMGASDVTLYAVWVASGNLRANINFNTQNCIDTSGSGNSGAGTDITYFPDNSDGYAASFNGTSSFIDMPVNFIRSMPNFTILMRFKTPPSQYGGLFGYQDYYAPQPAGELIPMLTIRSDGLLFSCMWDGTSSIDMTVMSSAPVNDNNWHTLEFNVATNSIKLYIDGIHAGTVLGDVAHLSMLYNQIGVSNSSGRSYQPDPTGSANGWYFYNGLIDDFTVYSTTLH